MVNGLPYVGLMCLKAKAIIYSILKGTRQKKKKKGKIKKKKKFKKPYKGQNKAISITFKIFLKFFKILEKIQRGDPWKKKFS